MMNGSKKLALFDVAMAARFVIGCGCLLATWGSDSRASSVTVPLDFEVVETADGAEVVAAFDFGVKFSEIESVTFSFVMPEGYEGTAVSTGNSSYTQYLLLELRDEAGLPDSGCVGICMVNALWSVPAGQLNTYNFLGSTIFEIKPTEDWEWVGAGETRTIPEAMNLPDWLPDAPYFFHGVWPDIFLDGVGQIAVADYSSFATHLISTGAFGSVSETRMAPDITMATLTITGTLVPEPSGVICEVVLVGLGMVCCRLARGETSRRCS